MNLQLIFKKSLDSCVCLITNKIKYRINNISNENLSKTDRLWETFVKNIIF